MSRVASLRAAGRTADALALTRSWSGTTRDAPCEARALRNMLSAHLALPPPARTLLVEADSLEPERLRSLRTYRPAEALRLGARQLALRAEVLGENDPETIVTRLQLAAAYHSVAAYDRVRALAEGALKRLGPPTAFNATLVAEAHRRLGILEKDLRRYDDAGAHLDAAARSLEACGCRGGPTWDSVQEARASLLRRRRRFEEAEAVYRDVLPRVRGFYGPTSTEAATSSVWFAYILYAAERFDDAESVARPAKEVLAAASDRDDAVLRAVIDLLLDIRGVKGDAAGAESLAREGGDLARRSWAAKPEGFGFSRESIVEDRALAAAYLERGDTAAAWPYVDGSNGGMTRTISSRARDARFLAQSARLDSLARAAEGLSAELVAEEDSGTSRRWGDLASLDGERFGLEARLTEPAAPDSLSTLNALQDVLARDEAVLGWFRFSCGPPYTPSERSRLWGYVVRRDAPVLWVELGRWTGRGEEDLALGALLRLDKSLRRASEWGQRVESDPAMGRWARETGLRLFEPLRPYLRGVRSLIVCPGPMATYPPVECWKDSAGVDLVDTFAISYAPSPSLLTVLRSPDTRPRKEPGATLLVGDPHPAPSPDPVAADPIAALRNGNARLPGATLLDAATVRSALAGDRETIEHLPPLPFSAYEVAGIARTRAGARVLTGAAATEDSIAALVRRGGLKRFEVLHFATHALADPDDPAHFALVLRAPPNPSGASAPAPETEDGLVSAREILTGWRLDGGLVTLSGCQTGGDASVVRTGEPIGFLQALLRAGADSVLLSAWKVDDLASALLMVRFYQALAEPGTSKGQALSRAKRWLRDFTDAGGRRPFANPVYWSGFVLYGDPH